MLRRSFYRFLILGLWGVAVVALIQIAQAHGSMQDPLSRVYSCYLENPETPDTVVCRDAIAMRGTQPLYDWNEVHILNAAGNHQALIPDGQLCSGGNDKYAAFDVPRTDWPRTVLPASGMYTFLFNAYVPHNLGYFELYATRNGYDPTQPLAWADLDLFALVEEPPVIDGNYYMPVQLPEGRSGHHLIYAIWQRNDSPEAFYSCSDVWFGPVPTPTPTPAPACTAPVWNNSVVYQMDSLVSHNNRQWRAKWSNAHTEPSSAGASNPWEVDAYCQSGGTPPTATNTPPPTGTPTQGPSPTPTNTQPPTQPPTATHTAVPGVCQVNYEVVNLWGSGFTAHVVVTNHGAAPIPGWTLAWTEGPGQLVTGAWNATVSQSGSSVSAGNPAGHWNGTIGANGGSVSFGFQANHPGTVTIPTNFVLNGQTCNGVAPTATAVSPTATNTPPGSTATATAVPPTATQTSLPPTATATTPPTATATPGVSGCAVNYAITNDWGSGFTADVIMTNSSGTAVNGWSLAWSFSGNQIITNLWNGNLVQTGQSVSVTNAAWNGNIPANSSVSFGFQGSYSGSNAVPTAFTLNGQVCN